MKKILFFFAIAISFLGMHSTATAQGLTGRVNYKTSAAFKFSMDSTTMAPEVIADLQKQLKKQMEREYTLSFTQAESNWKQIESLGAGPATASAGGAQIVIQTGNENRLLYKNIGEQSFLEEEDLMGKQFLVYDSLPVYDWELTGNTKKIGEYEVQEAKYSKIVDSKRFSMGMEEMEISKDTINVTAWFAPQIPVSHGPADFWGLPGLILELQNEGMTYIADRIVLNPSDPVAIEVPKKGEKINSEAYRALADEKMKDMMKRYNGKPGEGNRMEIRISN
ncbi:GLPGLI family protein [Algoriphagus marinus]|uniref:GLPGLI family protein n=1 Tax=Algoriphagus marinus TaxID=1925762 RepID=UPI00094BB583|nr:GLPGLI family protein [Algoriphagus marinus]